VYRCKRSEVERGIGKNDGEDKCEGHSTKSVATGWGWKPYGIGYTNTDLWKFFETKSRAEDNDELADKIVAVLDALRTYLFQFLELGYRN